METPRAFTIALFVSGLMGGVITEKQPGYEEWRKDHPREPWILYYFRQQS